MRESRKGWEAYNEVRVGSGKMRVSGKGGEGDDEDRVGRGKMRVCRKGEEEVMKKGKVGG